MALAPLPFGSVPPLWKNILSSASLGLLAAFLGLRARTVAWPAHGITLLAWASALFCLACVWIWIQTLSITPGAWHHPAWTIASEALDRPLDGSVSINPSGTVTDLISLLGVAAVFLIAVFEGRDPQQARRLVVAVALIGFAYAIYGLVVFFSGNEWVAWSPKRFYADSLSSTFVNRNSYGVFAGLATLAAVALLTTGLAAATARHKRMQDRLESWLQFVSGYGGIWLLAVLTGLTAQLLSASRAANAASLVGIAVFLAIYLAVRRTKAPILLTSLLLSTLLVTGFFMLSGDVLSDRLQMSDGTLETRADIYELTLIAINDHFWLGAGYGAFEDAFRLYSGLFDGFGPAFSAAHSVYLETIFELGVPAAIGLFLSVAICVYVCARGIFVRRRDRMYPALAISATLIVGLQGIVDFAIQTPSIATLYAVILGLGVAQSTSRAPST